MTHRFPKIPLGLIGALSLLFATRIFAWANAQELAARKSLAMQLGNAAQQMVQNVERYRLVNAHRDWGHNELETVLRSFEMSARRLESMINSSIQSGVGVSNTSPAAMEEIERLNSLAAQSESFILSNPLYQDVQPAWIQISQTLAQMSARIYSPGSAGPPAGYGNPITDPEVPMVYDPAGHGADPYGSDGTYWRRGGRFGSRPGRYNPRNGPTPRCVHGPGYPGRCSLCRSPRIAYPANQYLSPGQMPVIEHQPLPGQNNVSRTRMRSANFDSLHGIDGR